MINYFVFNNLMDNFNYFKQLSGSNVETILRENRIPFFGQQFVEIEDH